MSRQVEIRPRAAPVLARSPAAAHHPARRRPAGSPCAAASAPPAAVCLQSRDDRLTALLARSVSDRVAQHGVLDLAPAIDDARGAGATLMRAPIAELEPPEVVGDGPADLPPPEQRRMIRRGSTGREVGYAQERLNAHIAAGLATDEIFGPLTQAAAKDYQRGHALDPDAIIGPRTWASLDGPTTMSGGSGAGSGGGAGGPGSTVLLYDSAATTFTPRPGLTIATVNAEVAAKQKAGDLGPNVTVKGVAKGSQAELYLWNVLLLRAVKKTWGSELDTITQIGPAPAKPAGAAAPIGQVTIRIDGKGNAEAVLVAAGAPAAVAQFKDIDTAKAALQKDFGFSLVRDGTSPAAWTLDDLSKTHAALSRLPTADRVALKGVELVRETLLFDDDLKTPLAGKYDTKWGVSGTTVVDVRQLALADLAFANDAISFIGGAGATGPASFQTIVHEAGHAVEKSVSLDAKRAESEALVALMKAQTATNAAVLAANAEGAKSRKAFKAYAAATKSQAAAYKKAVDKAVTAINAFANDKTDAAHPKTEKAAAAAIAARDAEKGKLPAGHPAASDFAATSKAQNTWFASGQTRSAAKSKLSARRADLKKTGEPTDTARVKAFVAFVNAQKIPPLTKYAKDKWPDHPQEFFAEAYSLWLNDPEYLNSQAPALKTWFDTGQHRV